MISQLDKFYLNDLLLYNRTVEQRNKQLRLFAEGMPVDYNLLDSYNALLVKHGQALFLKRSQFLQNFIPCLINFMRK